MITRGKSGHCRNIYLHLSGKTMASLGFLMLGAFMGWVIAFGLYKVENWNHPANVFSAVTGAAVSGAIFIFIQYLLRFSTIPFITIFFYPVGLAYGALCNGLGYAIYHAFDNVNRNNEDATKNATRVRTYSIAGLVIASALLLALLFWLYSKLPSFEPPLSPSGKPT